MNDWTVDDWRSFLRVGAIAPEAWSALEPAARGRAVRAAIANLEANAEVHAAVARRGPQAPNIDSLVDPRDAARAILREEAIAGAAELRGTSVRVGGRPPEGCA